MAQKGATGDFVFIFPKKIFPTNKKRWQFFFAAARLASILAPRWTDFFYGQPDGDLMSTRQLFGGFGTE